jgi:hypothetical protein
MPTSIKDLVAVRPEFRVRAPITSVNTFLLEDWSYYHNIISIPGMNGDIDCKLAVYGTLSSSSAVRGGNLSLSAADGKITFTP